MVVTNLRNSFNPCPKISNKIEKNERKISKIKQKSKKQAKLERDRDKNIIKSGRCEYCGKIISELDPHEVFGGSNRIRSIKYNFVKLICRECHSNENIIKELRIEVQKEYEKTHSREEFIKIIGKSYIK